MLSAEEVIATPKPLLVKGIQDQKLPEKRERGNFWFFAFLSQFADFSASLVMNLAQTK